MVENSVAEMDASMAGHLVGSLVECLVASTDKTMAIARKVNESQRKSKCFTCMCV